MVVGRDAVWATTDFGCGDVLMFHYLTVHGARANLDPRRIRVSVDCRYRRQ
jgi:ectoine hydroxylase-related dioxygenase (phytanoyl-CoA dioxygenase family)